MSSYEILAKVKFNDSIAVVLNQKPVLKYLRLNSSIIYGTDEHGIFYNCYRYERPSENWKAFAGRKFDIKLEDGEVIHCHGQWWDGGYTSLANKLGIRLCNVTYDTIERLKRCYVFTGLHADMDKYWALVDQYKHLPIREYWDYEKILKYDVLRGQVRKLKKDKESLIKAIKAKHQQICAGVNNG